MPPPQLKPQLNPELNFDRAEYHSEPIPLDHCVFCSRGISGEFYRTNGDLTCSVCAIHLQSVLPHPTRQVFWRSAGHGLVTAIGASLAYLLLYRFLARFGYEANTVLASIPVGYAIGRAMQWAGPAARGRRFQLTGAFLTYAAIAAAHSAGILPLDGLPILAYPFLIFAPIASLFLGHFEQGLYLLFFISIGIRWTWTLLRPHGIQIIGPQTLPSTLPPEKVN